MESTQQFKYSKTQLRTNLFIGIAWILLFFAFYSYFFNDSYFNYGYLAIGIIYFGIYFYKKHGHYAVIKNGVFTKTGFFPKHMKLEDISEIKYFNDEYILKSETSEITINANVIDETAIEDLQNLSLQINASKI